MGKKSYETVVVLSETLSQEDVDAAVAKLREIIEKNGGSDVEAQPWGKRRLAYEIKQSVNGKIVINRTAHYVILSHRGDGTANAPLERQLNIEAGVIRYQTYLAEHTPDSDPHHYRNVDTLAQHITDRGKIRPGRSTRLTAKEQRHLTQQIKRARYLGLLPFTTVGQ